MTRCMATMKTHGRHTWKIIGEVSIPFPGPNGVDTKKKRPYQTLQCTKCPEKTSRWKPGSKPV